MITLVSMTLQAEPIFDKEEDQHVPRKDENKQASELNNEGMPEYPLDSNLRRLNIRQSNLIYYVDLLSITPGKDRIVRLITVAISPSGARTVTYEGLDCGYRRFKAYGAAGSEGPLQPLKDQGWNPIIDEGNGRYRMLLVENYLCENFAFAASRSTILARMKGLKPFSN